MSATVRRTVQVELELPDEIGLGDIEDALAMALSGLSLAHDEALGASDERGAARFAAALAALRCLETAVTGTVE